jgi:hypothetical protein
MMGGILAEGAGFPAPSRPRAGLLLLVGGGLLGDDLILDLVVGRGRHDLLLHQIVLARVRPVLDDLLGVRVADAGQRLQLVLAGGVEIQRDFVSVLVAEGLGSVFI